MTNFRLTILDPSLARVFDLPVGITLVGREPATNLPVVNPQVSRRHAQFSSDGQLCELTDLGSANGTFVNDERLTPHAPMTLADGARIRFGPVEVRFEILPPAEVAADAEMEPDYALAAADLPVDSAELEPDEALPLALDLPAAASDLPVDGSTEPEEEQPLALDLPSTGSPGELPAADGLAAAGEGAITPVLVITPVESLETDSDDGAPPALPPDKPPPVDRAYLSDAPFDLPGLSIHSQRLINFLPGIYQSDFMARFLGIFESIQTPIEWTVDAFDLFLDPDTSPSAFLDWLGSWYGLTFDASWSEDQRRQVIREAHTLFARRGTRWALARVLEIYTGSTPEIVDTGENLDPFTFRVRLPLPETNANRTLITRLIDAHKPAYTTYRLELQK